MAAKPQAPTLIDSLQAEVAVEASPMMRFLVKHARGIAVVIALCIVAIIVYWFYSANMAKQQAAELQKLGRIVTIAKPEERMKALDAYLAEAPDSLKRSAWFSVITTADALKDYEKAYIAWKAVAATDSSMKVTASLGMAQALMDQGKLKEALETLDGISANLPVADVTNVNSQIVVLAENAGNYARALQACNAILAAPESGGDVKFWAQKKAVLEQKSAAGK